jgi:CHAD domain-containing protein
MAYRLKLATEVPAALRTVLLDRLESAAQRLEEDHGHDPVEAIHGARTDLKKARAALRLAAPGMPSGPRRAADHALRDRGRALAASRDADVALETLSRLADELPADAVEALRVPLTIRATAAHANSPAPADHAAALRALAHDARGWPLDGCDSDTLARGLARTYARGRDDLAAVSREPTTEVLHEWRKRVKDHWYHLRLVRDAWPDVMSAYASEARALSRLLGDDHDLAVFAALLEEEPSLAAQADGALDLVSARRSTAQHEAVALGGRLYAERTRAFARRMRRLLNGGSRA